MPMKFKTFKCATLNLWKINTPIGHIEITCCESGLHSVIQTTVALPPDLSVKVSLLHGCIMDVSALVKEVLNWFTVYFEHPKATSRLCIPIICSAVLKSDFRKKALLHLASEIQAGETVSYKKLAELIGNQGAVRAVGSAMSNNPISIIIPCHRVIKSNGDVGKYAGGFKNDVKKWLLEFERDS
ncbi:methylated-DNA--protein-cysteine methyltransferase [Hydra vulgaris]|uniref:Methylated-DNA--protein-cysteine methyltransferase n=1 Tax=Hydra vulgaris TaxID=6087 RepID=A0ABM4BEZ6_HYDVU